MLWRFLVCVISCFVVSFGVSADHCTNGVCHHVQQAQHVQAVVTPIVTAVFQPVTVAVPVYGVGYSGSDNSAIINELRLLRQEMQQLRLSQTERKEALQIHPGLAVLQNRCAACHDDANARTKANNIQFFTGVTFQDVGELPSKILEQIHNDHMPKGKEKLSPQEKYDVLRFFTVKEVKK